ncbi:hypothetical protein [Nocardioides sp.]|uniref:hypothetical protein n=1 Tax=Nocardioides sp. TaxID=35761 RepID=UPI0026283A40|nr:hypothetical protein [Nocardioides sp.]MDI6911476.1 hypothetical protein [Nocardioides sp.]
MAHVVNDSLVAFVRLATGGTVKLHAGDTVPAEADPAHVAGLVERGVLTEVKEPKGSRGSGGAGSSGDQS